MGSGTGSCHDPQREYQKWTEIQPAPGGIPEGVPGGRQGPFDNSATERAIRPFTVGRANWHIIDTVHGAEASAMVYSLVETAKANKLKIYEYLKHLLTEIPKHMDDTSLDFLEDLLPWSENLPEECRKQT
jgi:hypothetical protein